MAQANKSGVKVTVGGSLASALKNTGSGIEFLQSCFREIVFDDGRSLTGVDEPFLSKVEWGPTARSPLA